jgi:hypothetical protein
MDSAAGGSDRVAAMACPLMFAIDWLNHVSATFWGVLAGSFFSLGGVWLSNRNSARNLKAQHEHDRKMRAIEREMALRKDVYLAAAEALSTGFVAVARFADLKIDSEAVTAAYIERAPAIAKVNIVGGEKTLREVATVTCALNTTYLELHAERMGGGAIKSKLGIVSRRLELLLQAQGRSIEMMKEESFKGRPDAVRWEAIQRNHKFECAQIETDLKEQIQLEQAMGAAQLALSEQTINHLATLNGLLAPLIAAVRDEIGMQISAAVLHDILVGQIVSQQKSLNALIQRVRAENIRRAELAQAEMPGNSDPAQ